MKKYIILLTIIIIMLITTVFAEIDLPSGWENNVPAGYDYSMVCEADSNDAYGNPLIKFIFSDKPLKIGVDNVSIYTGNEITNIVHFHKYSTSWSVSNITVNPNVRTSMINLRSGTNNDILISNYDIYKTDGTVFFSLPTQIFPKVIGNMNLLEMMTHPLVGLIASLIGLWIIYLGFSKAWQFLSKTLQGA